MIGENDPRVKLGAPGSVGTGAASGPMESSGAAWSPVSGRCRLKDQMTKSILGNSAVDDVSSDCLNRMLPNLNGPRHEHEVASGFCCARKLQELAWSLQTVSRPQFDELNGRRPHAALD